jgi:hypothetical protein
LKFSGNHDREVDFVSSQPLDGLDPKGPGYYSGFGMADPFRKIPIQIGSIMDVIESPKSRAAVSFGTGFHTKASYAALA